MKQCSCDICGKSYDIGKEIISVPSLQSMHLCDLHFTAVNKYLKYLKESNQLSLDWHFSVRENDTCESVAERYNIDLVDIKELFKRHHIVTDEVLLPCTPLSDIDILSMVDALQHEPVDDPVYRMCMELLNIRNMLNTYAIEPYMSSIIADFHAGVDVNALAVKYDFTYEDVCTLLYTFCPMDEIANIPLCHYVLGNAAMCYIVSYPSVAKLAKAFGVDATQLNNCIRLLEQLFKAIPKTNYMPEPVVNDDATLNTSTEQVDCNTLNTSDADYTCKDVKSLETVVGYHQRTGVALQDSIELFSSKGLPTGVPAREDLEILLNASWSHAEIAEMFKTTTSRVRRECDDNYLFPDGIHSYVSLTRRRTKVFNALDYYNQGHSYSEVRQKYKIKDVLVYYTKYVNDFVHKIDMDAKASIKLKDVNASIANISDTYGVSIETAWAIRSKYCSLKDFNPTASVECNYAIYYAIYRDYTALVSEEWTNARIIGLLYTLLNTEYLSSDVLSYVEYLKRPDPMTQSVIDAYDSGKSLDDIVIEYPMFASDIIGVIKTYLPKTRLRSDVLEYSRTSHKPDEVVHTNKLDVPGILALRRAKWSITAIAGDKGYEPADVEYVLRENNLL